MLNLHRGLALAILAAVAAGSLGLQTPSQATPSMEQPAAAIGASPGSPGIGTTVYENAYVGFFPRIWGVTNQEVCDDLHLIAAGDLVSFTFTVSSQTSVNQADVIVTFYQNDAANSVLPSAATQVASFTVPAIPTNMTWTQTVDLNTAVPIPQDIWMGIRVVIPDGYASFVFDSVPFIIGTSTEFMWSPQYGLFSVPVLLLPGNAYLTVRIGQTLPQVDHLAFGTPPAATEKQGQTWTPFTVRFEDAQGNLVQTVTDPVTVSLAQGNGTLSGTLSKTPLNGVAIFDDLRYDVTEAISIDVTSSAITGILGTPVIVTPFDSDLRITSGDISSSPLAPPVGQPTQIAARVANVGTEPAIGLVRFYRGDPDFGGALIGQAPQANVPVGGHHTFAVSWTPATDGQQSIFAVVDNLSPPDVNPADNRASTLVSVGAAPEDLHVEAGERVVWPGATGTVTITITNGGFGSATITGMSSGPPSWLTLVNPPIGTTLAPGQSVVAQADINVPPGTPGGPLNGTPVVQPIPIDVDTAANTFSAELHVKVFDQPATDVTVRVVDDASSAALAGALVAAQDLPGYFATDAAGEVTLQLPPGSRALFAYQRGFVARADTFDIPQGASTHEIRLAAGQTLGVEQIVSQPLSSQEIIDRGVNVQDPINNAVFDFVVAMEIGPPLTLHNIELPKNPAPGDSVSFSGVGYSSASGGGGGGGGGYVVAGNFTYNVFGRTETWIIIPGQVWVLKQFFEVSTVVVNNAVAANPQDVQLQNASAQLTLPAGLGLPDLEGVPQNLTQALGTLDAGETTQATWIIRGDVGGTYVLDGLVAADLVAFQQPPGIPLTAVATSDPFDVTVPNIRCEFITPGATAAGQAFAFGVLVTNESPAPAQLVRVLVKEEDLVNCTLEGTQGLQTQATLQFGGGGEVLSAEVDLGDLDPGQSGLASFQLISLVTGIVENVEVENGCGGNPSHGVEVRANPPVITAHPQAQSAIVGNVVTFAVIATGDPPLAYQWRKDGSNILGATSAALSFAVAAGDAGTYDVVVSNPGGSAQSNAAVLSIGQQAPVVTSDPASQTVCQNDPVTFAVTATGIPAPTYQWRKDGVPIPGATGVAFTIASAATTDAGSYDVVVSNSVPPDAISAAAALVVEVAPAITMQPASQLRTEGSSVQFKVAAAGTAPFTYQWYKNGVALTGETADTLTIGSLATADAGTYSVDVSNSCGTAASAGAVLQVNSKPVIVCNSPFELWAPYHDLVDVRSAFSASDVDGDPVALTIRMFSDETEIPGTGDGTGNHAPDFKNELNGGRGLLLRSERAGTGNGRWYVMVVTADDGRGGVITHACALAVCPHDQTPASMAAVKAEAAAAEAMIQGVLDSGGALPPPGVNEHGLAAPQGPKQ